MRFIFFSLIAGLGFFYLTTTESPPALPSSRAEHNAQDDTAPEAPVEDMVRIQGKWYKYRADNRYLVDGVPTLHIAKKPVSRGAEKIESSTPAPSSTEGEPETLARMAEKNPLAVYTPKGMQVFRDGLRATQERAAERKKTLDAWTAQ